MNPARIGAEIAATIRPPVTPKPDTGGREVDVEDLLDREAALEREHHHVADDDHRVEDLGGEALRERVPGPEARAGEARRTRPSRAANAAGRDPRPGLPAPGRVARRATTAPTMNGSAIRRTSEIQRSRNLSCIVPPAARAPSGRGRRAARRRRRHGPAERAARLGAAGAGVPERDDRVPPQPARVVSRDVEPARRGRRRGRGSSPSQASEVDVGGFVGGLDRRAAPRRRGSTGRRPGRCRSRRPGPRAGRGRPPGSRARTCVQYERHRVASSTPGSSSAPVGHASMQRVHEPQPARIGGVGSSSAAGDERPEHDPGAVPLGDQHRVLAVEADAGASGGLAVDVLVRVDEHAVGGAERARRARRASRAARRSRRARRSAAAARGPAAARAPGASSRARRRRRSRRRRAGARDGTRPRDARS